MATHTISIAGIDQSSARWANCVTVIPSNENKMSDGGRERATLGVKVWKSSQKWSVQRSAVRSIAWLDDLRYNTRTIATERDTNGMIE
jgi:hypothetical protein